MDDNIHQNILMLIQRMEDALERDDFANVLHSSASIFETLAKDVIATPKVQDKTLKQLFDNFRQKSNLPKEVLDYVLSIYNSRNTEPLAGHGSTKPSTIKREHAITLCELTKAFVNIEYKSRKSAKTNIYGKNKNKDVNVVHLALDERGLESTPDNELLALLTEALYDAQKDKSIKFEITSAILKNIEDVLNKDEFQNPSPENRIVRVNLLKLRDREEGFRKIIEDALNLISTESILNLVGTNAEYLLEIINGVPRHMLGDSIEKGTTTMIDIFRKSTRLSARFYLNKEEIQLTLNKMGVQSESALIGGGWDFYDLPIMIRFQKAIPAMLVEVATNKDVNNLGLSLDEILYPGYWNIGLA